MISSFEFVLPIYDRKIYVSLNDEMKESDYVISVSSFYRLDESIRIQKMMEAISKTTFKIMNDFGMGTDNICFDEGNFIAISNYISKNIFKRIYENE